MKTEWAVEKVLLTAGLREQDFTPEFERLARSCLDQCYYIDLAANEFLRVIGARELR